MSKRKPLVFMGLTWTWDPKDEVYEFLCVGDGDSTFYGGGKTRKAALAALEADVRKNRVVVWRM